MKRLSLREALLLLVAFWAGAAIFLVLWWRSTVAQERVNTARACSTEEVFAPVECRATVTGTVAGLTSEKIKLDVDGRRLTMPTSIGGTIPNRDGMLVQVTLYRGKPIRVEGAWLSIDAADSPSREAENNLSWGLSLLIGPVVLFLIVPSLLLGVGRFFMWITEQASSSNAATAQPARISAPAIGWRHSMFYPLRVLASVVDRPPRRSARKHPRRRNRHRTAPRAEPRFMRWSCRAGGRCPHPWQRRLDWTAPGVSLSPASRAAQVRQGCTIGRSRASPGAVHADR